MDKLSNFGKRLKDLIEEKQITPDDLSKAINYNQVYHWLAGDYIPSFSNLIKIADYFQCTLDYLTGKESESLSDTFKSCPSFAERLPFVLKAKGFTIYRLSKLTKIDKRTIYDWLHNLYVPQLDNLDKIASVLDCTLDYLVGRE